MHTNAEYDLTLLSIIWKISSMKLFFSQKCRSFKSLELKIISIIADQKKALEIVHNFSLKTPGTKCSHLGFLVGCDVSEEVRNLVAKNSEKFLT